MRDCPKCGAAVDGAVCPLCGEGKPAKTETATSDYQCAQYDRGQRCANPGVYSPSTYGKGPWYCRRHDPRSPYSDPPADKTPLDLTPQQWANVCRFWPTVAAHAAAFSARPLIGPDSPLWASAKRGQLLDWSLPVPLRMREPGEEG